MTADKDHKADATSSSLITEARIPVFVSAPSPQNLNEAQKRSTKLVLELLVGNGLEWRALGRSDYAVDLPLKEVWSMIRHCSGGIVLGFRQAHAEEVLFKQGSRMEKREKPFYAPTPWNHLEAGMIYSAKLPLLVFREKDISGGIFDYGSSEVFIQDMPAPDANIDDVRGLRAVFRRWTARVYKHYYDE